jgi:hypothetical protein
MMQLHREALGISDSSSSSASLAKAVETYLLTRVCPKYTAEELKTSQLEREMKVIINAAAKRCKLRRVRRDKEGKEVGDHLQCLGDV